MSKRSRAERRQGQLDRAIRVGDLEAIRSLVEKSPEKAAAALLQACAINSAAADAEALLDLIVATSAKLRQNARFDLALQLTTVTAATTPRLRFERALAALGSHDDVKLTELIAADAELAKLLRPCLAVLQDRPLPKLPAKSPSLLRAVHGCCRAAVAVDDKKAAQLRTALAAIAPQDKSSSLTSVWQNLYRALNNRLHDGALAAARTLLSLEPFKSQKPLRAWLGREVGIQFSAALRGRTRLCHEHEVGAEFLTAVRLAEMDHLDDPVARLRYFLDHGDLQQLPETERGTAALYQGYMLIASAPQQAFNAFDRAVALGADLAETLRGRWLATQSYPVDYSDSADPTTKVAEKSAERLIHLLEREPDGKPLCTILQIQLGFLHARTLNDGGLKKTLEALRSQAQRQDHEVLRSAIQGFETILLARTDPNRALEQLLPLLEESNPKPDFWEMAVALMRQVGRHEEADRTVLRAAKLSISPKLTRQAQKLYRKHRLASISPEAVTAGLLAHELVARIEAIPDSTALAAVERVLSAADLTEAQRRLPTNAQSALDAATLCILSEHIQGEPLVRLSVARIRAATEQGRDATWIAAAALHCLELIEDLMDFAHALSRIPVSPTVAEATVLMVALGEAPLAATQVLHALSHLFDADSISHVIKVIETRVPSPNAKRMRTYLGEAARHLLPEFDLLDFVNGGGEFDDDDEFDDDNEFDDDDEFDDEFDDEMTGLPTSAFQLGSTTEIRRLFWHIGLPQDKIQRLSDSEVKQLLDALTRGMTSTPTPQSFQQVARAFTRFGFTLRDLEKLDPTKRRPLRDKGLETCPF